MATLTLTQNANAPLATLWDVWNDYENIHAFHPGLVSSHLLEGETQENGVGAKRQCNLKDGKNWLQEVILEHVPQEKIVIDIFDSSMPLKSAVVTIAFSSISASQSRVKFTIDFEPKMGILGKMMVPMMKMQFKQMIGSLLATSVQHAENANQKLAA